ncbi:MAG: 6,7-dimethyl-8-ribityllumazine synthase [Actinomycetota bacterium]
MSGAGAPTILPNGTGVTIAIIAASWHEVVMNGLIDGAERACAETGATAMLYRVPGTFELSLAAQKAAAAGFDAVVALGVVIRGDTPHFDYVCSAATDGLNRVSLDSGTPIGFGVLTCDDEAQALARAGLVGSKEDKGFEATVAALALLETIRGIRL